MTRIDVMADTNKSVSTKSSLYLRGIIIRDRFIEGQLNPPVKVLMHCIYIDALPRADHMGRTFFKNSLIQSAEDLLRLIAHPNYAASPSLTLSGKIGID